MTNDLRNRIFRIKSETEFQEIALEIFNYQYNNNLIYRQYIDCLGIQPNDIDSVLKIPFMPIDFFKTQKVVTGEKPIEKVFGSSGTTRTLFKSSHFVSDLSLYEESLTRAFKLFYGRPEDIVFFALLPSYVERSDSSLVYMVQYLTNCSYNPKSRIDRTDIPAILHDIEEARDKGEKVMLIGVSFALLDMAEKYSPDLSGVIVMETGGMKGRRREMTREELHMALTRGLNVESIHSEYGMTELLSQAYSTGKGIYNTPSWMKILLRDTLDPLSTTDAVAITGGINVVDLANINSCSFIATGDLGKLNTDGSFEVLGRFDHSDIRGCNLLAV